MTSKQLLYRHQVKIHTLLIFCSLVILSACNRQNTAESNRPATTITNGDNVSALSNSIWVVFQAANGDYWFGSDTNGVYKFDGNTMLQFSTKDGLSSNRIRSIQEDEQGNIYFATLEGINKFDGQTFTTLSVIKSQYPGDNWKLQDTDIWFSTLGKNGENGPLRYDGQQLYQLEFPKHFMADDYYKAFPNSSWSPYDVYQIYKDSKGSMWFGTSNLGICRYDGISFSWLYEDHLTNTPQGGSFGIRSILEDEKGKFWFCNTRFRYNISPDSTTENGKVLVKYERETGIDNIRPEDGKDHVYFMSAVKDDTGNLWMATYSQGVYKYNGENVLHFPVRDGAEDITLFSIYKDKQGGLWLGTHTNGVYKLNGAAFEKFQP